MTTRSTLTKGRHSKTRAATANVKIGDRDGETDNLRKKSET